MKARGASCNLQRRLRRSRPTSPKTRTCSTSRAGGLSRRRTSSSPTSAAMADRYAVIGNPVEHSKSPRIHAEFARQTGEDMEYGKLHVALDDFEAAVDRFRAGGGR